jgi:hypothetical protein
MELPYIATGIIAVLAAGALAGAFLRIKERFTVLHLRLIGIILVATFATLLALAEDATLNAAMGILGAIVGYLFGVSSSTEEKQNQKR